MLRVCEENILSTWGNNMGKCVEPAKKFQADEKSDSIMSVRAWRQTPSGHNSAELSGLTLSGSHGSQLGVSEPEEGLAFRSAQPHRRR